MEVTDPVPLWEVLGDEEGIPVDTLMRVTRRHDIVVGELIDEELLLCGADPDPDKEPDPHWMPHLARLDAHERRVAVQTTVRHLDSLGVLELQEVEGQFDLLPPHSLVAHALRSAAAVVTWRLRVRDEGESSGAIVLVPGGLVLHDEIDDGMGQHQLVLRSAEREAAHLAAWMDPRAMSRTTEPPVVASAPEDLEPAPDRLAGEARTSTLVARVARTPAGGLEQAVTAYGTERGLWLLQGRRGPDPVATLQLVDDADLLALARRLTSLDP